MRVQFCVLLVCGLLLMPVRVAAQVTAGSSSYVGAAACKECHGEIFEAWQKTKHATAINRLSDADRASGACIQCHVTGSPDQIAREGANPSHPGVQCEGCHGAGATHVESANAGGPTPNLVVRKPKSSECERCHNDKGPHFRGFMYDAMVGFSHRP